MWGMRRTVADISITNDLELHPTAFLTGAYSRRNQGSLCTAQGAVSGKNTLNKSVDGG